VGVEILQELMPESPRRSHPAWEWPAMGDFVADEAASSSLASSKAGSGRFRRRAALVKKSDTVWSDQLGGAQNTKRRPWRDRL